MKADLPLTLSSGKEEDKWSQDQWKAGGWEAIGSQKQQGWDSEQKDSKKRPYHFWATMGWRKTRGGAAWCPRGPTRNTAAHAVLGGRRCLLGAGSRA